MLTAKTAGRGSVPYFERPRVPATTAPSARDDELRAWLERTKHVPDASGAGKVSAPDDENQRRLPLQTDAEALAEGYTRWSDEPPPAGVWIEIIRLGRSRDLDSFTMGTWWPPNVDGLWWRAAPIPDEIVDREPAPVQNDTVPTTTPAAGQ